MKKEVMVIIAVCVVVAIITAFVTTNITGNVVSVGWWNKHQVYTVDEVDKLIEDLNTGNTPIYYTKSEIDNLLKTLASGETVVINNNDTYTKAQIDNLLKTLASGETVVINNNNSYTKAQVDSLINSINKTTVQQTGINSEEILKILNQNKPTYDYLTIRGSGNHPFPNNCDEVCKDIKNWNINKPMICIGAIGVYWKDISNSLGFYSHHYSCDTPRSTYLQNAFSESDEVYAQCICVPY